MSILLERLRQMLGDNAVLTGSDASRREVDWLSKSHCRAAAILRPATPQQVQQIMQLCHEARQPVVTHGGLTGLVHGAEAGPDELVVSLERMNAIEHIDPVAGTIHVQAGVPLQQVQEAAAAVDMQFPVDLGARGSCTIGGNIATNAGGNRVIRFGMMRQQVLGLEAVLANGDIVSSMSPMLKNNAGYDLKQLFIGSEGTLGIVTRAVLRLQPAMPDVRTALLACPNFEALTALLPHLRQSLGGSLSAFEVMWQSHFALIAEHSGRHNPPLATDAPYYALVESLAIDAEGHQQGFDHALEQAFEQALIEDAVIAQSSNQRDALWAIRDDIEGLVESLAPLLAFDVSLPIEHMQDYVTRVEHELHTHYPQARLVVFGHLGDGNLHLSVGMGNDGDDTEGARHQIEQCLYQPLAELNGSISAEHGIGLEKRDWLHLSRSPAEMALMTTLKQALDPHGLLNRDKVLVWTPPV
ncbi:FAD-binding oxidoreductase [Halomonas huangheensis]|uniref:FAD-binding oxidoreductase n=1 Tax=Halomonas huangheensis TaxID=1178482 RepID=UPI0004CE5945|nr:FAD-binding oxidoreductase [Halomonas huangheensis]ALM54568.1 FAD-linked oxidase [Halomonas huangheensis]